MDIFRTRAAAVLGTLAVAAPLGVGVVSAAVDHSGPPASWGPPLEDFCADADDEDAADAGYVVIVLGNGGDTFVGTSADEAIFSRAATTTSGVGAGTTCSAWATATMSAPGIVATTPSSACSTTTPCAVGEATTSSTAGRRTTRASAVRAPTA